MSIYLSSNSLASLVSRYREKGLIFDTNLLLLLLYGLFDKSRLSQFRRVTQYSEQDFEYIYKLAPAFNKIIVTPQILAELTNLMKVAVHEEHRMLQSVLILLKGAGEKHFGKDHLSVDPLFMKLGFTDISILAAARKRRVLVVTDDLPLTHALRSRECDVLNLNDVRTDQWL